MRNGQAASHVKNCKHTGTRKASQLPALWTHLPTLRALAWGLGFLLRMASVTMHISEQASGDSAF